MATPRTFTISLPPKLARQVDKQATAEGRTRSELFREAVRQYIARRDRWNQIFDFGEGVAMERALNADDVDQAVGEERNKRSA
ncbi:MAG: ribbon-helix-helix domain-containing protein [Actinobacteria bacterium]|nr:ribbon-helix-helix domain-containing protein [Actinomycetota bacterium]